MQLPNVVTGKAKQKTDSIFESFAIPEAYRFSNHSLLSSISQLFDNVPRVVLREHYRCHPKIIEFCNKKFYDDQLIVLTSHNSDRQPLVLYHTAAGNHARNRVNQRQIDVIFSEVVPKQRLNVHDDSIGIVSPYRNHTNALQNVFQGTGVEADTVDKFQGRQKDTIILCTVDNEISEFVDNPNRLNVAISRAINQLIIITDGNESYKDSNFKDLIDYIKYNNFEIHHSEVYSIFDYLYKCYAEKRRQVLSKYKKVSKYDSENLMYGLLTEVLKMNQFSRYDVANHVPLKMIIRDPYKLDGVEVKYFMNDLTHADFLIYNKFSKKPVLAIEVDGYWTHLEGSKQAYRDKLKNRILTKYNIPFIRFRTTGSNEKQRLIEALSDAGLQ